MNSKKMYFVMLGVTGFLLLVFLGGSFWVHNLLASRSKTLVDLKLKSTTLASQQADLATAKKQIKAYSDLATIARSIVPQDKDQAEAVREITKIASDSGIPQLSSIVFPDSTLGGTTGSSAPKTSKSSNLTQLVPVPGISGVYVLQLTVSLDSSNPVSYTKFTNFLANLERNRRTAQVSSINLQPDAKTPSLVSFSLIINEYVKP